MIWDYLQNDPRWANHPYSAPGGTMADSGCGPTAIADVVGVLPPEVGDYMTAAGYAAPYGQGTYWSGIIPSCEHFGHSGIQMNGNNLYGQRGSETEKRWIAAMQSGKYYGILLMGKGYFTQGGHFIAIEEVSENAAKCYDPAWSVRSGWHPWYDFYQGCVEVFYLVEKKQGELYIWILNKFTKAAPEPAFWSVRNSLPVVVFIRAVSMVQPGRRPERQ